MKEKKSLSEVVQIERLKEDCGSTEWSVLTEIGDNNDLEILNQEAIKLFRELEGAKASAVREIPTCCKLSYFQYLEYRASSIFVH